MFPVVAFILEKSLDYFPFFRDTKKTTEKISNLEQEVKDIETKLLQMKAQRDEIEQDAAKLLKCVEEVTEQVDDVSEKYHSES